MKPEKKDKKACIRTFGCQMNKYDSKVMADCLAGKGFRLTGDPEEADVVIFNTCSVRKHAEDRFFSAVNGLKPLKRVNPSLIIAVCGCTAQKEGGRILQTCPHVDIVLGTRRFPGISSAIEARLSGGGPVVDVPESGENGGPAGPCAGSGVCEYVTAVRGCSNFCSYCVVPYLRGSERSRTPDSIACEVRLLAENGVKEVCLLGQNILAYGRDIPGGKDIAELLRVLNEIPGIERLRFLTSHPRDLTDNFIEAFARLEKVCESVHLPAQSGSDRVLELMGRGYTRDYCLGRVRELRRRVPGISVTTDIIAGFPSETTADFRQTVKLMEEVRFDDAFLYRYSPREFTRAGRMPGQVGDDEKKARLSALIDLQQDISRSKNNLLLGSTAEVLVESKSKKSPGMLYGRTRTDKNVIFPGGITLKGRLVNVRITRAGPATLTGQKC